MSKRMGRPTDNPKPYRITVRIDEESRKTIEAYCKQKHVGQMEAVRQGIKMLEADLKK